MSQDLTENIKMPPQQPTQTREQFIENLFQVGKKDNIYSNKEAREKLITGVNKLVDVVKSSYGASGSNCIIEDTLLPYHRITNDGKTIVDAIHLADSVENIGANIVKEVAAKSDKESGDGRKTSMILLQAILNEFSGVTISPMEIKHSLDKYLPIIIKAIESQSKKITVKNIEQVATTASESKELGKIFGDIYKEIGQDGIIELDNSGLPTTFYDITEGVRLLNCGFQYPYMATEDKGRKAIVKTPYVLITKQKISNIKELDSIMRQVFNKGKSELVIFADEIDLTVSQALAFAHQGITPEGESTGQFKVLVIKAPTLWKNWLYEDFAKITGATIIDPAQGTTLKNFQFNWLGYCDKIITSKNETVVLGIQDIKEHIKKLEEDNTDDSKLRISRLKTKTAILKLGANSESELSYIRGKALDARNSSYLALEGGIVDGGGIALSNATNNLLGQALKDGISETDSMILQLLANALIIPMDTIFKNMGYTENDTYDKYQANLLGIYDSTIVVKNALINALSVASTILTTENVITLKK